MIFTKIKMKRTFATIKHKYNLLMHSAKKPATGAEEALQVVVILLAISTSLVFLLALITLILL